MQRAPQGAEPRYGLADDQELQHESRLPIVAHPHLLRHACSFALADQGADTRLIQGYLGHNIQHIVQYTATNPARFGRLWPSER